MPERRRIVAVTSEPEASALDSGLSVRTKRIIALTLACYWLAMFIGTHIPIKQMERLPKFSDKVMHFGAYAGLAFLFALWRASRRGWNNWSPLVVLFVMALYGVADELLQKPVNRSAEVADFMADMLGSATGIAVFYVMQRRLRSLLSRPSSMASS